MTGLVPWGCVALCNLLLLTTVEAILSGTANHSYNISPTCLGNETRCLTLSRIANEADKYFTSNTTLAFLPGDHNLEGEIVSVANISDLTLMSYNGPGLSNPKIFCGSSSFSFASVSELQIVSINFISCRLKLSSTIANFQFSCFENSMAAMYKGSNIHFLGNSRFIGNGVTTFGGAVFVDRSNLTFTGNSSFIGNTADKGGAVRVRRYSVVTFSGISSFVNNSAVYGGAVHSLRRNTLIFDGNSTFLGNIATHSGGAMYAYKRNTLSFKGGSNFVTNEADYGGAVAEVRSNNIVSFVGNSNFVGNKVNLFGGAVSLETNNIVSFGGNSTFIGNKGYSGGAVSVESNNIVSFDGNSTFVGNKVNLFGGAVSVEKSNNVLTFDGNSTFIGNKAYWGGAVSVESNNIVSFDGNSTFVGNKAFSGGAVSFESINIVSFNGNSNFVGNKANWWSGAVSVESNNIVSFNGNSNFVGNKADWSGGAVSVESNNIVSFDGNSNFVTNMVNRSGGAISVEFNNLVSFNGNSNFTGNKADWDSGAVLFGSNNIVSFDGNSNFVDNTADFGGAVSVNTNNTVSFNGNNNFFGSKADWLGGAVSVESNNIVSFNGNSNFVANMADRFGGAVSVLSTSTLKFNGNNSFFENRALIGGGAVSSVDNGTLSFDGNSSFIGNQAETMGGAALFLKGAVIFDGISYFTGNVALFGGGIGVEGDCNVKMSGSTNFSRNQATYGGAFYVKGGNVLLNASALFRKNSALQVHSGYGGAIYAINSEINLEGNYIFSENRAIFGGGLALSGLENRILFLQPGTSISFEGNVAYGRGGAIHIEDNPLTYCIFEDRLKGTIQELCFVQTFESKCNLRHYAVTEGGQIKRGIRLTFLNNTATESGDTVYGGSLEYCWVCSGYKSYILGTTAFKELTTLSTISDLKIASDPFKVCLCEHNIPNCSQNFTTFEQYPGQNLSVFVVAVGQLDGVVPSVIHAVPEGLRFSSEYITQQTKNNNECTELRYPLVRNSTDVTATLKLYSHEPCSTSGHPFTVSITFLPCPTGFSLSDQGVCGCERKMKQYTQDCDIQNQTISRQRGSSFWVGVDHDTTSGAEGLILHPHCPFDYCTDETVEFSLNNTDTQCRNRRSGVLCGACQSGYSLALGSTRCIRGCSNNFLALLLPFAAAGLALVIFLFSCNLTVAKGTISGLILYANVLAIDQSLFFPSGDRSTFTNVPRVFIAWLNLDLGIETCFFKDLDIYSRTLLQFAFPFYIWVLVGLTIYLADISTTVAKLIGSANPVAVLATLFLLSYTKLLRTIMAAFSFTTLSYPKDESKIVWLYDGNIEYWDGKHVALFLVNLLVFLIFFLPYTLFLLCGQWIQRKLQLAQVDFSSETALHEDLL